MSEQIESKINRLEQLLPEGLLVDASWLEGQGYYRSLRAKYVSSGWLEQPIRGVYRRPRGILTWEQVVVSLQTLLGYPVSVGGRTALELQGFAHYVPQITKSIHLYSDKPLPTWLNKLPLEQVLIAHNRERWIFEDGLLHLLVLIEAHLFREAWWRETGEWLGPEHPHDEI